MNFDYTLQPGEKLKNIPQYNEQEPIISVIMPFYNDKDYIQQTVNSVVNQTFPYFELLIIDDGSTDKQSIEILHEIEKLDSRIRILHKKNEGIAATRDYGVSKSSDSTKYLLILDSDDVIDKTFLECTYWTLETNQEASWAYSDSVGFGESEYLWNKWFDSDYLKSENFLVVTALIRKKDFLEVKGYELREKAVNEDWNFWLKMIAKGKFPVHMGYYGFWYRRKKQGELSKSNDNKKRALEIIENTAKTIKNRVEAIQYPKSNYHWDGIEEVVKTIKLPKCKENDKINILMIIPWMITGGADKFNLDLIAGLDKEKFNIIILSTEPNINTYRQQFEKYAIVYDLTTFLDKKYWISFINYLIEKNHINLIFNTNSKFGYSAIPYMKAKNPEIPIVDYIHMEEWYNRNGGYSRDSSMVADVIDRTLLCNKNSEKVLVDYFKRNPKEVQTVYIGVDEKEFDPSLYKKQELVKKYNIITDKKFIISYICRITEQKRPYLLLEIIKKLKEQRNDFLCLIVGDGNMLKQIKQAVKTLKVEDCVMFLGNVTKTKEIYAISDLTINCSIKEGLALTSYESLSMGVPVVSCDVGGQKELITEEVGAIVPCLQKEEDIFKFEYQQEEVENYIQAINKILNKLETYKNNCRKRILEGFTINHMIKNMSEIFEQIQKSPNQEKVKNGEGLKRNIEITKELVNINFMANEMEYNWLCEEYNRNFYGISGAKKWTYIKNRLWDNPLWRFFIRFLQKTGIMKLAKKTIFYKKLKEKIRGK
ncbi:MAG: glycosyltransferase [Clostridia bacterium]|nr:glycosyltransferase [Clostridia bacterium]